MVAIILIWTAVTIERNPIYGRLAPDRFISIHCSSRSRGTPSFHVPGRQFVVIQHRKDDSGSFLDHNTTRLDLLTATHDARRTTQDARRKTQDARRPTHHARSSKQQVPWMPLHDLSVHRVCTADLGLFRVSLDEDRVGRCGLTMKQVGYEAG